ncbi:hypothetical protein [Algoriphagus aquimarinus]|uniref:hypothetical protein n=1 Tax=Algoriphagus aquimarinus TaxID=237018 RepID=UPI0030DB9416|tara:strand:+ start:40577 stop:40855 length:279 start_codon:yes stop_codon:yes gene_type:complete
MNPENFEQIWGLIRANEGQVFNTIRHKPYKYTINGNAIQVLGNQPYNLSRGNFLNALPHFDPQTLATMPSAIVGRSYVWGIYNGLANQIAQI